MGHVVINPAVAMSHFLRGFIGYELEDDLEWSDHFFARNHGARGYAAMFNGPEGTRFYAYPSTGKHCHLEIAGELLESFGMGHR